MKLFVQPESGIEPLLEGLRSAKKSIQILIFRFDRTEVERALVEAVQRGVQVQALIAFTNRGEEKNLRKLESRLLGAGVTVSRTADDLVRYHGKMFIIDRKELWLLAFNYTHMDITLSRSFAAVLRTPEVVAEAVRLFETDIARAHYKAGCDDLVVSPANARVQLMNFIRDAKKQLLLYEMKISDPDFMQLLAEKKAQGVDVRIIGKVSTSNTALNVRSIPMRLHVRAILRDGKEAFLGSQSLRKLEMEARREIGVIFRDTRAVREMIDVFEKDWASGAPPAQTRVETMLDIPAHSIAKSVIKHIHVESIVELALERVMRRGSDVPFEPAEVTETVREAFRAEVHDAVMLALQEMAAAAQQVVLPSTRHDDAKHPEETQHVPGKEGAPDKSTGKHVASKHPAKRADKHAR